MEKLKQSFSEWTKLDFAWLVIANSIILGLGIMWKDSMISIISSLAGVTCVIFVGKQMLSNYYYGVVNVILYAYLAFQARLFGDFMLNAFYYLPMNIVGLFVWSKAITKDNGKLLSKKLSNKQRVQWTVISIVAILVYSLLLKMLGGNIVLIDSTSTVLSVVAMYLLIKQYLEQWYIWILVNLVSIVMWVITLMEGNGDLSTLLMWVVFLINSIFGLYNWKKSNKNNK